MKYHINYIHSPTVSNCETGSGQSKVATTLHGVPPPPPGATPGDSVASRPLVEPPADFEKTFRGGATWFYWLGALSLVNSLLTLFGVPIYFPVGLAVTQIFDELGAVMGEATGLPLGLVGLGVNVVIASFVALFGILAHKRMGWVFVVGMMMYVMDGLLFVIVSDWLAMGFHGFVLFCLFKGFQACRKINAQSKAAQPPTSSDALRPAA